MINTETLNENLNKPHAYLRKMGTNVFDLYVAVPVPGGRKAKVRGVDLPTPSQLPIPFFIDSNLTNEVDFVSLIQIEIIDYPERTTATVDHFYFSGAVAGRLILNNSRFKIETPAGYVSIELINANAVATSFPDNVAHNSPYIYFPEVRRNEIQQVKPLVIVPCKNAALRQSNTQAVDPNIHIEAKVSVLELNSNTNSLLSWESADMLVAYEVDTSISSDGTFEAMMVAGDPKAKVKIRDHEGIG
jgi:hypothetical protein